jgi:transposase
VVARELGIGERLPGRWMITFRAGVRAGDGAPSKSERAEMARLRRENSELKLDRAFLKNVSHFFALLRLPKRSVRNARNLSPTMAHDDDRR